MKPTAEDIAIAAKVVREGGLVVYPTDTVYGLGCDPFNVKAIDKLIQAKGERENKPLPILAAGMKEVEKIATIQKRAKQVAEQFWPGALTIILPKKEVLPDTVTFGSKTIGVRIPNHRITIDLIRSCGGLLIGTSANRTGEKPVASSEEAIKRLGDKVDVILDGGICRGRTSSTVVDLTGDKPKILRKGSVSTEEILEIWEKSG